MRGYTTLDRARYQAGQPMPITRGQRWAGFGTALLMLCTPLVSAIAPGGILS